MNAKATQTKTTKTAGVVAAVMPIVSSKSKQVFLKVARANGNRSVEATTAAIAERRFSNLDAELREFAKTNLDAKVWTSRVATIAAKRLSKSAATQEAFWKAQGFTVVNTLAI